LNLSIEENCFQIDVRKSNLYYTRLILFRLSRVSGAHLRGFFQVPHIKFAAVANRWQRVGDLIGSRFEPHTFRIRGRRLTTCAVIIKLTLHLAGTVSVTCLGCKSERDREE